MKPKTWKNIQRTAYLFFALIYVHVLVLYFPRAVRGTDGYLMTVTVYTAVWALYLVMRLRKYFLEHRKSKNKAAVNTLSAASIAVPTAAVFIIAGAAASQEDIQISAAVSVTQQAAMTSEAQTLAAETTALSTSEASSEVQTLASQTTAQSTSAASSEAQTAATTTPAEDTDTEPLTTPETTVTAETTVTTTAETTTTTTIAETEAPARMYNDGTFDGKAYGYDGYIYVTITVENDMITSISSTCEEEDISYWLSCREKVISQITETQQTQVDAVSGATYSSNAIMKAVAAALETARKDN